MCRDERVDLAYDATHISVAAKGGQLALPGLTKELAHSFLGSGCRNRHCSKCESSAR
jgi:hypothetical protein